MNNKVFKFILVCILCIALVYGLVWLVQNFIIH